MKSGPINRRKALKTFFLGSVTAAAAFATGIRVTLAGPPAKAPKEAAKLPMIDNKHPLYTPMQYKTNAKEKKCIDCAQYAEVDKKTGTCTIFSGVRVGASDSCISFVQRK